MNKKKKFQPVSTKTIKEVIQASTASKQMKEKTIDYFKKKGVFLDETVSSLALGILLGEMLEGAGKNFIKDFSPIFKDLRDTSKLPIIG